MSEEGGRWEDALTAAALLAFDPHGVGGVVLRARAGAVRERWLAHFRSLMPMAERCQPSTVAHLCSALDHGKIALERDGITDSCPTRVALVALDEGIDEERVSAALRDRLALHLDLDEVSLNEAVEIDDGMSERLVAGARGAAQTRGTAGVMKSSKNHGRRVGVRRGAPRGGARLNVLETLRAAAPWQPMRRALREEASIRRARRVEVRKDDFRIHRYQERTETTTIFVVDASGSAALQRLAEAKGAVERVLADCYVRLDQVAMIALRDDGAKLVLPPTKSLVRAKRILAGLPGGGATPLAAGIDAGLVLAKDSARRGQTPVLVFMTDGRANVARDGTRGRSQAREDALASARALLSARSSTLFVDTGARSQEGARELAAAMGARYLNLPYSDVERISETVQSVGTAP